MYVNMPSFELTTLKSAPKLCLHFFSGFLAPLCILLEFTYGLAFLHGQHMTGSQLFLVRG